LLYSQLSGIFLAVKRVGSMHWRSPEDRHNFILGLGASLVLHATGLGGWILALMLSFSQASQDPNAAHSTRDRIPTLFVEVNPDMASAVAPQDTPYYSTVNSLAANPDPQTDSATPQLDGSQDQFLRLVDIPKPGPQPLQPSPPPEIEPLLAREPEPVLPDKPVDLAVAPVPSRLTSPAENRARTVVEARLRKGLIAGPQSRQPGGASRRGAISIDARASPLGGYDAALIAAIQQRWWDLLDDSAVAPRSGRVVVEFTLHQDGRVTEARIVEQEVGEILALYCRKAITDPAPYARWPAELHRLLSRDYREVRVTFHYY
jgi:outer membrane biosynthesis protein TonB